MRWLRLLVLLLVLPVCVVVDAFLLCLAAGPTAVRVVLWASGYVDLPDWREVADDLFLACWARGVRRAWGSP